MTTFSQLNTAETIGIFFFFLTEADVVIANTSAAFILTVTIKAEV